jgi:hypothetical protein
MICCAPSAPPPAAPSPALPAPPVPISRRLARRRSTFLGCARQEERHEVQRHNFQLLCAAVRTLFNKQCSPAPASVLSDPVLCMHCLCARALFEGRLAGKGEKVGQKSGGCSQ